MTLCDKTNEIFRDYIEGDQSQRRKLRKDFTEHDWIDLVRYAFDNYWKSEDVSIPESIGEERIRKTIGVGAYNSLKIKQGNPNDLLAKVFPNYGVLDDEKCKVFISKKGKSERFALSKSFFQGGHTEKNAKKLIKYAWENEWKSEEFPIPELIGVEIILQTLGDSIYPALNIRRGNPNDLLAKVFSEYGVLDDEKCKVFISQKGRSERNTLSQSFFHREHAEENAKKLIKYAWENEWRSEEVPIPELIGALRIQQTLGAGVYTALKIKTGNPNDLLAKVFPGYGILDDEKCKVYISKKGKEERVALGKCLFHGKQTEKNAKKLIEYAWKNEWKSEEVPIPELIGAVRIQKTIGDGVYKALNIRRGNPNDLLAKVLPEYGVLDDEKCKVYISKIRDKWKELNQPFFHGEHTKKNAKKLIEYAWENEWKSEEVPIPELIGTVRIQKTLGEAVYKAFNLKVGNPNDLLAKVFQDYGILDNHKSLSLITSGIQIFNTNNSFLFGDKNPNAQSNIESYLEAYQEHHEKRLTDLDQEDFKALPLQVRQHALQRLGKIQELPKKRINGKDPSYNSIQIEWNPDLESTLRRIIVDEQEDPYADPAYIWQELGISPFAAHMKAQELGIIPETVIYGNGEKNSIPIYRLIEVPRYEFADYAILTATKIEHTDQIDVQGSKSPVHGQFFHINAPIHYKVNRSEYTEKEWEILQVIATYLENPNTFRRETKTKGTFIFHAPEDLTTPNIAATRIGEDLYCQVFQRTRLSQDPGGVHSAVLQKNGNQIYLFMHHGMTSIQETQPKA